MKLKQIATIAKGVHQYTIQWTRRLIIRCVTIGSGGYEAMMPMTNNNKFIRISSKTKENL